MPHFVQKMMAIHSPLGATVETEQPDLSLVMPCYNEAESLPYSVSQLLRAFERAGYRLQLVAVNNGSHDRTADVIAELAARHREITAVTVEANIGYGHGILSGVPYARAQWIGTVAADGQVDAEDLVRLYEAALGTDGKILAKVRRRFRMDGVLRKIISVGYNGFVQLLWPGIGTLDVNGQPRLMRAETWRAMELRSANWLLDLEMVIKAHYMGLRIVELNVFARMRGKGISHVRLSTCWEFFTNLLRMRFSGAPKAASQASEDRSTSRPPAPSGL
ncbi:MAG: glycosyltransferase family 2 protein [Gemmatimonadaceae bacterium]